MIRNLIKTLSDIKQQVSALSDCDIVTLLGAEPHAVYVSTWNLNQEGPRWELAFEHRGPILCIGDTYESIVTPKGQRLTRGTIIAAVTNNMYQYIVIRGHT
jgi:hypothetical protein